MVVDLPDPLGPRKPCTSPASTVRSSPSRARTVPNFLTRPRISMGVLTPPTIGRPTAPGRTCLRVGDVDPDRPGIEDRLVEDRATRVGDGEPRLHGPHPAQPGVVEHLLDGRPVSPGHHRSAVAGSGPRGRLPPRRPAAPGCRGGGRSAAGSGRRPWCGPARAAGRSCARPARSRPGGRPRSRPCGPAGLPRPRAPAGRHEGTRLRRTVVRRLEGQAGREVRAVVGHPARAPSRTTRSCPRAGR